MNYYSVSNETDLQVVGAYLQCKGIPTGDKYNSNWFSLPNSMTKLTNRYFPIEDPILEFELKEKAKLTDIISVTNLSAIGLLVNQRTKNLLEGFNLAEHKFFKAKVKFKRVEYDYFWLHFVKDDFKGLDLRKTIFYNSLFKTDKHDFFRAKSYNEVLSHITPKWLFIGIEKLVLDKKSTFSEIDVFYLPIIENIIINEKVIYKFINQNITGIKYQLISI